MHSETGGPGEERPVQLAAKAPADGDGDGESPPSGGHGEKKTGRRWIVITAAGVAAFAALLTAITTTASTLYNLDRRPIATRPASPRRTGAVSTPAPRPGPRSPGSIAGTPATTASPGTGGPAAPTPSGPPAPSAPSAGQGANAGGSSPSVRTPRAQVTRSPSPPARSGLVVSLNAQPADGGTAFNRYINVSGRITGPRPNGQLWLVWAGQPKPSDPKQVEQYYAKGEIHLGTGGSFSFYSLTMGDTSQWSVGRTWRVFVAVATTPAAQKWLQDSLANNGNPKWDGNRLALQPGARQLGTPIFVTRSS